MHELGLQPYDLSVDFLPDLAVQSGFWVRLPLQHSGFDCSNQRSSVIQEEQGDTDEFRDVSKKVERREALTSLRQAADIIDTTVQVSILQHYSVTSSCAPHIVPWLSCC